ncbi:hypothetical protein V5T82_10110 [Magnetovibrio sp. PR-2]|uniref:hypothetical protein n=1 Tax=Magnetovibrio sp. PR-2 TaxID=3120356 RepID=UPI002FCE12C6
MSIHTGSCLCGLVACVLFDDSSAYAPSDELFTETKQNWTVLNPDLPHDKGSRKRG